MGLLRVRPVLRHARPCSADREALRLMPRRARWVAEPKVPPGPLHVAADFRGIFSVALEQSSGSEAQRPPDEVGGSLGLGTPKRAKRVVRVCTWGAEGSAASRRSLRSPHGLAI